MASWLIENAAVVTMDDEERVLPEADILIQGAEIAGLWASGAGRMWWWCPRGLHRR